MSVLENYRAAERYPGDRYRDHFLAEVDNLPYASFFEASTGQYVFTARSPNRKVYVPGIYERLHRYVRDDRTPSGYRLASPEQWGLPVAEQRVLAATDRYYLLTSILNRPDAANQWVYDRCREVEAAPDDHLDLWARYHYKSTIITFAGIIQEIINDPEITVAIFGNTKKISQPFLDQIKLECETNPLLKELFPDVFYADPQKESPQWSSDKGIVVKRKGNPKEATVSNFGLLDAMPTGGHFKLRVYDDVVTEKSVSQTNTDQIAKTTQRWELSQNLGTHDGGRQWHAGTRYHFADTYGVLFGRGSLKPRVYPATHDGTLNGEPVFLTKEAWEKVKRDQRGTVAAQMLLNPLAGEENTFLMQWLRPYELRPALLTVYIMCDPSLGKNATSDRTAMPVVGIDVNKNVYFLDGYCHRMRLSQRWEALYALWLKWKKAPGVQFVKIGYERYGMQSDMEYIEDQILKNKVEGMNINEVAWVREGPQSKPQRIARLEPYFRNSRFWMPNKVWAPQFNRENGICTWRINDSGDVVYLPYKGASKAERAARQRGEPYRLSDPIRRVDQDGNVYDLTRMFFEEFKLTPFAPHDDLLDGTSRFIDLEPVPPMVFERGASDESEVVDA